MLYQSSSLSLSLYSDYTRETLSQSHDSVFSESATASSLSIVLKVSTQGLNRDIFLKIVGNLWEL